MSEISTVDARALYRTAVIDVYKEKLSPMNFLRSFFPAQESTSKNVSIEVVRGYEKIAVDVTRGTDGNRNSFGKSTQKIFAPPYYREFFDMTDLDLYDRIAGSGNINDETFAQLADEGAEKTAILQDKIERAYELQCAQVLQTGLVLLASGDNIDFKRKADSMVDLGAGNYWSESTVDPNTSLEVGCRFIREKGKSRGSIINAICGSQALMAFINNDIVKERGKIVQYALDLITPAQRDAQGASFHGEISVGAYRVRLWSYPEVYTNAAGDAVEYIDPKKVILLPEKPRFKMAFAAVPQLLVEGSTPTKGAYRIEEYIDLRKKSHIIDIQSAGVPVPVAVDQIYTVQVLAD